jgi:arylsulfatase
METVDEEFYTAATNFMSTQIKAKKPFFVWFNSTRMHIFTHLKPSSQGKTGLGLQADGMVEHDAMVGDLLKFLDDNHIADNTIVIYSTDNGAMKNQWPDGGSSPFAGEKDMQTEGAFRVPALIRWPGVIKPGTNFTGLFSAEDWLPTLVAAAGGDPNIAVDATKGVTEAGKTFKVHLDGYNQVPYLSGQSGTARHEFVYFDDDGDLVAYRDDRFKYVFSRQDAHGMEIWRVPMTHMRAPVMIDLLSDPYEYSPANAANYEEFAMTHAFLILPAVEKVAKYLQTYQAFPPRQAPATFSIDQVIKTLPPPQVKN